MLKIYLIQIGKIKNLELEALMRDFLKRISGMADISVLALKESRLSKSFGLERVREEEAKLIAEELKKIGKRGPNRVFLLDENGREFGSEKFASKLGESKDSGGSVTFVVGGAQGLSAGLKREKELLALSRMTFTHEMAVVILAEQIYRALSILAGKEYHNA